MTRNPQARRLTIALKLPQCEAQPTTPSQHMGKRCHNLARYDLDGHKLCARHAGPYALAVFLGEDPAPLFSEDR